MKKILLLLGMFTQVMLAYSAPDWSVNSSDFEYSLTITGIVEYDGIVCAEGDILAAFVNGECRGVGQSVYEESMDKYYFYLTVFSNTFSGEQVSFKYYNASQDLTFDDFEALEFEEGLNLGNVSQPYVIAEAGSMNLTYTLTFVVTDGTTAIEAAEVSINGTTVATDASGNAVFADMASASYDYTVTAVGYDNATGSVTIVDADIAETVSMTAISTGINDLFDPEAKILSIYPNPVKDFVNIEIDEDIESISIYNSIGQIMYVKNTNEKSIDLSELKTGIYFLFVQSGLDMYQERFLKN